MGVRALVQDQALDVAGFRCCYNVVKDGSFQRSKIRTWFFGEYELRGWAGPCPMAVARIRRRILRNWERWVARPSPPSGGFLVESLSH